MKRIRRETRNYGLWVVIIAGVTLLTTAAVWLWQGWDAAKVGPGWGTLALALRGYIAVARIHYWTKTAEQT